MGIPIIDPAAIAQKISSMAVRIAQWTKDIIDKVRQKILYYRMWIQDFIQRNQHHIERMVKFAKFFSIFMKTMAMFFPIIIVFRMIIGFFQKPMEFVMLGVSIIVMSVVFVMYFILTMPPFIYIPFIIWFIVVKFIPFLGYVMIFGVVFVVTTIFCGLMAGINAASGNAIASLILCQNDPDAWFKMPNWHFKNRWERGMFCSRPCLPGFKPSSTGMFCERLPRGTPSHCPQASVMRMYVMNKTDMVDHFKDYPIVGNLKYLSSDPQTRELLLKKHYLRKRDFLSTCKRTMAPYDYMPLNLCSSLDAIEKSGMNGINPATLKRMRVACAQSYCNSSNSYPFCAKMSEPDQNNIADLWKRILKIIILISTTLFVFSFIIETLAKPMDLIK